MQRRNFAAGLLMGLLGLVLAGLALSPSQPGMAAAPQASRANAPVQTETTTPSATGTPDCNTYSVTPSSGVIVPGTSDTGNHGDDVLTAISLPFAYDLYGVPYTTANLSSNGVLEFNAYNDLWINDCLPQPSFDSSIFAYWDDLRTDCEGCGIFTSTTGIAPNRVFNIEWRAEYLQSPGVVLNFEVRLYEGQTTFDIVYGAVPEAGVSATVGVQRDESPNGFTQYECNTGGILPGLDLIFTLPPCPVTATPTSTDTATSTSSSTATSTPVITVTPTGTATETNTVTPTNTPTDTNTDTPTDTATATPTTVPANTSTSTLVATVTLTPTYTVTMTSTPLRTGTATPFPTCTGRVQVCHRLPWPWHPYVEITISCRALPAHLRHGDLYPVPPGGCPAGTPNPRNNAFTDVSTLDYFYDTVLDLSTAEVISGYADGTFRPYNTTTRAQLVKMVVLAFQVPADPSGKQYFSDVPRSLPFFDVISAAYTHGLISGYGDGTFRPYDNITRGQITKVVVLASGFDLAAPAAPSFTDVPVGSSFFQYIETAYAAGILNGYADATFKPNAPATRGQVSKIVDLATHP
jgi:hypothetical protein